ncbi:MFS transporter [Lacisediminihabitans profunda]|uniref:MFS transporter n=1 Tax=Lacisediminihabitans profunda TaxID=2594790 RepID=A0A5C8UQ73_9MICO|nr:MFS transporter [Lacisediminihabitans profunda]TXN30626.1 MFS transporter [Lacisediminihabitans profunda]
MVLVSAQFVVMLDTAVVNVALPSIQHDLHLTQTGVAWVVNAYFLAFGGFLLLSGRAADLFGRRRMFMAGAALFTGATLLAGIAPNETVLVVARTLQGLGAAVLSPSALSVILVGFPGAARAKAMSAWGAASAAGGAVGVSVGGLVTAALGWQWVFFITIPITLLALVSARFLFVAGSGDRIRRTFDAFGAITITGAALALIYATLSVVDRGWFSVESIGGAAAGVALLIAFVSIEKTAADPIVPLALFRQRAVSAGVIIGLLGGAARVSAFLLSALYLQQVLLLAPDSAGIAMLPTSVAGFVVSLLLLPRILRAIGPERTLMLGLLLLAAGHLWLARNPAGPTYSLDVLPGLLVAAAGVALSFTPSTMVIASGVPASQSGLASGLANASSQVGGAIGIAAFSAVAAARMQEQVAAGATARESIAYGLQGSFAAAAIAALVAAAVALRLLRGRPRPLTVSATERIARRSTRARP